MVTLTYHQGKELSSSSICVEFKPIELAFITEALEVYARGKNDLSMAGLQQVVGLQIECSGSVNEFKNQREAWRKEARK